MFLTFSEHQNITNLSLLVEQKSKCRRTDWCNIRWPRAGHTDGRILQNLMWAVKPKETGSFFCRTFYNSSSYFHLKNFSFQRVSSKLFCCTPGSNNNQEGEIEAYLLVKQGNKSQSVQCENSSYNFHKVWRSSGR